MTPLPQSGLGLGWRPEIAGLVADLPGLRFCEVIAESLTGGALPPPLATLHERGVCVVPHGIALSLRDGWDFARALADAGELPELAVTELDEREGGWRGRGRRLRSRRGDQAYDRGGTPTASPQATARTGGSVYL